ncbi:MAG TPA: hypothetical protein VL981_06500 [Candidatus Methylacidiphilales bacterium]|nr:hypothetical protein [Candidatus Methylacidiphilales bacterium]
MKLSARLALVLLFISCVAEAQISSAPADAPDKQPDYNAIIHHFFEMVKAGKCTDAAHVLVDTNPQDTFNVVKHEDLAVPLEKIEDALGSFQDFKPLVNKNINGGIGYVYGLAIYERNAIRFEFIFYKDGSSWRFLHIDFNLDYVPEIRDLAGVHIPVTPPVPVQIPTPTPTSAPTPTATPKPSTPPGPPAPSSSSAPQQSSP